MYMQSDELKEYNLDEYDNEDCMLGKFFVSQQRTMFACTRQSFPRLAMGWLDYRSMQAMRMTRS